MQKEKLIGQGTHGIIYKINEFIVKKEFENRTITQNCICSKIKSKCTSRCDHIHYEYLIQNLIYEEIKKIEQNPIKINIPKSYNFEFSQDNTLCNYSMDFIHPPIFNNEILNELIQIDLGDPNKDEIVPGVGRFIGYNKLDLHNCTISTIKDLVYEVGKLFSYLHYILFLDGFDCELVLGRLVNENKNKVFLIDFDKVTCFTFNLDQIVYRKIDENTFESRNLKTIKKFAWFLFNGLTGMSLLPKDEELKNEFIRGYSTYVSRENNLINEIHQEIISLILEYE